MINNGSNRINRMMATCVLGTMLIEEMMCLDAELKTEEKYAKNKLRNAIKTVESLLKPVITSLKNTGELGYYENNIFVYQQVFENISNLKTEEDFLEVDNFIKGKLNAVNN